MASRKESKISIDMSMRAIVSEKHIPYCSCALHALTQCNQINFTTRERSVDIDAKNFWWREHESLLVRTRLNSNFEKIIRWDISFGYLALYRLSTTRTNGTVSTRLARLLCVFRWWVDFSELQVEWRTSLKVVEMLFYIFLWCSYKTKWHALGMLGPKR